MAGIFWNLLDENFDLYSVLSLEWLDLISLAYFLIASSIIE